MVSISSMFILSVCQRKLYHIYKETKLYRKVIWQLTILSIISFKHDCLNKLLYVFFVCIFRCYDWSRINSSNMQSRRLSVWSTKFNFNTLSCQNYFPRGYGVIHNTCGNSGGVGDVTFVFKNWQERGCGYFLELHIGQVWCINL